MLGIDFKRLSKYFWVFILSIGLTACDIAGTQEIVNISPTITSSKTDISITPFYPTHTIAIYTPTVVDLHTSEYTCSIGAGLRSETIDILLDNRNNLNLIMSSSSSLVEEYFIEFEGSIRVIGAPSLEVLKEKATRASAIGIPYEALGYGLETSKSTPDIEWQDVIGSTKKAQILADSFDKLLLMAPGYKLMAEDEEMYEAVASEADIYMLQTQQLQKNPPGPEYRSDVEKIVNMIRASNPDIILWAQITLPPDRDPDAKEWVEYHEAIMDLVDGSYIGVYTWDIFDNNMLINTINSIIKTVCIDS